MYTPRLSLVNWTHYIIAYNLMKGKDIGTVSLFNTQQKLACKYMLEGVKIVLDNIISNATILDDYLGLLSTKYP